MKKKAREVWLVKSKYLATNLVVWKFRTQTTVVDA